MLLVVSPWSRSGRGGSSKTSLGSWSILSGTVTRGSGVSHQPPGSVTACFSPTLRQSWIWILTSEELSRYRADRSSWGLNHSFNISLERHKDKFYCVCSYFIWQPAAATASCCSLTTNLWVILWLAFFFLVDINNMLTQFVFRLFNMEFNLFLQLA